MSLFMDNITYDKNRHDQLPLNEKFTPQTINDLALVPLLKNKIKTFVRTNTIPNLIITGPSGVGKTSTISCIANDIYRDKIESYVLELNASDDKGAKTIIDNIIVFCRSNISNNKKCKNINMKLIILNDADKLIERSQPQLSVLMDQYKNIAAFVFTCNTSSCIIESIQTKCMKIRFCRIDDCLIENKIKEICNKENIKYEKNSLETLAKISNGDLRNAINILQMIYTRNGKITIKEIESMCDLPQQVVIKELISFAINKKLHDSLNILFKLIDCGYSGSDIILGMMNTLKSDLCNDIPEYLKMDILFHVSLCSHRISQGVDTVLQLSSCLADIVNL